MKRECRTCQCWYANNLGEVRQIMDETGIECSLERIEVQKGGPCTFYQRAR
jgi:hypothetical protein